MGPLTCWSSFWERSLGGRNMPPAPALVPCSAWQAPGDAAEAYCVHSNTQNKILSQTSCLHTLHDGQLTSFKEASVHQPSLTQVHTAPQGDQGGPHPTGAALKVARWAATVLCLPLWPQLCPVLGLLLSSLLCQGPCQVPSPPTSTVPTSPHPPAPTLTPPPTMAWCQSASGLVGAILSVG